MQINVFYEQGMTKRNKSNVTFGYQIPFNRSLLEDSAKTILEEKGEREYLRYLDSLNHYGQKQFDSRRIVNKYLTEIKKYGDWACGEFIEACNEITPKIYIQSYYRNGLRNDYPRPGTLEHGTRCMYVNFGSFDELIHEQSSDLDFPFRDASATRDTETKTDKAMEKGLIKLLESIVDSIKYTLKLNQNEQIQANIRTKVGADFDKMDIFN